jgi:hypothetical protein
MAAGPFGGGGSGRASNGETFNKTPAGTRIPGGNNDSGLTRLSGESFREEKSLMKRLNIRPIRGEHDVLEDLKSTNPNYDQTSFIWSSNCQRTVPAWEARRRGYNATARPILTDGDYLSRNWTAMYKNPEIIRCSKNGKEDIIQLMKKWGEGARCEIAVEWPNGSGHVFAAENIDGEVWFFDPQTNSPDCSGYFDMVSEGSVEVLRTDNLEFDGNFIKDCIKEA